MPQTRAAAQQVKPIRCDPCAEDIDFDLRTCSGLVLVYKVHHAFESDLDPIAWAKAIGWSLLTFVLGVLEIIMLLSLTLTNNWPACESQDDCGLGLACTHAVDGATWQEARCLDCYFLVAGGGRSGEPWGFPVLGTLATGEYTNASQICSEAIYDPKHLHLFNADDSLFPSSDTHYTLKSCLYARATGVRMSTLDFIVLVAAVIMLAFQVTLDAKEQDVANYMRRRLNPWFVPERNARSWAKFALLGWVKFLDVVFRRMIPCLLPCALCSLLSASGSAQDTILDGLAVGFIYELDDLFPQMILSHQQEMVIKKFFVTAANRFAVQEADMHANDSIMTSYSQGRQARLAAKAGRWFSAHAGRRPPVVTDHSDRTTTQLANAVRAFGDELTDEVHALGNELADDVQALESGLADELKKMGDKTTVFMSALSGLDPCGLQYSPAPTLWPVRRCLLPTVTQSSHG